MTGPQQDTPSKHLSPQFRYEYLDVYRDEYCPLVMILLCSTFLLRMCILITPLESKHGTGKKMVEFFQEREQFIQSKERQLPWLAIFASKF